MFPFGTIFGINVNTNLQVDQEGRSFENETIRHLGHHPVFDTGF